MNKVILFIIINILLNTLVYSQISKGGLPVSFNLNSRDIIPTINMDKQDVRSYISEDVKRDKFKDQIWRFGINIPVSINVKKQSIITQLSSGILYRTRIYSEGAVSINFRFSKYKLPKGAKVFIYNDKHDEILGAFTSVNNKKTGILGVSLLFTNAITIEYFEPNNAEFEGELQIDRVTHGYRSADQYTAIKGFGNSGPCNNDVVCPKADNWGYEIKSSAMLVSGGSGFCSGALINNTNNDETPYFLTANHCYTDPSDWVFWFNWHRTGCQTGTASSHNDISGAILRARNTASDFCLVEISTPIPANYNVFYSGWDKRDINGESSVGIHHPSGDVKKISWDNDEYTSSDYEPNNYLEDSHWEISCWDDGTTEGGSSGSPLYNSNHRIIGQLHGGWASCTNLNADFYGKFSMSWNYGGSETNQLQNWLDPQETNPDYINGYSPTMATDDVQLMDIENPVQTYCEPTSVTPTVQIRNLGFDNITSCNVTYTIDDESPITQIWTGNISTFETSQFMFPAIVLASGEHIFTAYTSNPNGVEDTVNNNDTLTINYEVLNIDGQAYPIIENFETAPFPSDNWEIINADNNTTWERTPNTSNISSTAIAYIKFSSYSNNGAIDELLTPWIDLNNILESTAYFTFKVAYRRYSSTWNDGLNIFITDNCGSSWTQIYSKASLELATGSDQTSEFIPSQASDWRTDSINLTQYLGNTIRLKFQGVNGYGNNLYIDDINIDVIASLNEITNSNAIELYPNPAKDFIVLKSAKSLIQSFNIINITGKTIISKELAIEKSNLKINISSLKQGVYFVEIKSDNVKVVKKIIVK